MERERMEAVLYRRVRPKLVSHNGEIRLVDFYDGIVEVELLGACAACSAADYDTKAFIEDALKQELPEVKRVEIVHTVPPEMMELAKKLLNHC